MGAATGRRIVIGIGNRERGDDAVGRAVAQRLRGTLPEAVTVAENDGEPAALLDFIEGADAAFFVDACRSGAPAGTVRRLDAAEGPLAAAGFAASTHGIGLAEAIELARTLRQMPPVCVVYAIEGQSFDIGAPLSPPVAAAIDVVAGELRGELAEMEG